MNRRTLRKSILCLALVLAFMLTLLPGAALAHANIIIFATSYDRNAGIIDGDNLPGVYAVKAQKGDRALTMGIPSIAKQNLEDGPTTQSPAIITGAAVPYEVKTGATEFTPIEGGALYAPYSYFRYQIIEEANPNGADGTHKKMSGFDGTYYILRVDVSELIAGAPEGSYLHVKQDGNKALLVAIGQTIGDGSAYFVDSTGSKAGAYSLDNAAASLKDKDGYDMNTPYIDVVLISSGTVIAGADTGSTDPATPTADVGLSFYVDQVGDYDPSLVYDPAAPAPTDPNAPTHEQLMMKKYFDESKVTADDITSYTVKGSDLEIEVKVSAEDGRYMSPVPIPTSDVAVIAPEKFELMDSGAADEFWSLRKAMAWEDYNNVPIKLICEVPVLEGLVVEGTDAASRCVILDVNSFDIQVANHQSTNAAAITVSNATFELRDRSNTTGAELAVGNNANLRVKSGGRLVIDKTCQLEIEYDAASTTATEGQPAPTAPNLTNGIIVIEAGGEIENNGIITIEGTEGKPIDPAAPAQRDVSDAIMNILPGALLTNNGCLLINGSLYNLGTIVNNGRYNDLIKSTDPDKGNYTYHKGIQLSWKDDVTQNTTVMGSLVVGMDRDGNTDNAAGAKLVNTGDVVLVPGYLEVYGQMENSGTLYVCAVDEAIIPVLPTADKPTVTEKRVKLGSVVTSYFVISAGASLTNTGTITAAEAEIVNNGRTGELNTAPAEKFLSKIDVHNLGDMENSGTVSVNALNTYATVTSSGSIKNRVILKADDESSGVFENSSADRAEAVYNGAKIVVGDTDIWSFAGDPVLTVTPADQSVQGGDVITWSITADTTMPGRDVQYLLTVCELNPFKEVALVTLDGDTPTDVSSVIAPVKNDVVMYEFFLEGTMNAGAAANASVEVTSTSITAPAPIEGLEYNGKPQTLITTGGVNGEGRLLYKRGEDPDYSAELPTATDAGIYSVYYMLEGAPDSEGCVYTTINPKLAAVSANDASSAVGEPIGELTYTVSGAVGADTLGDIALSTDAVSETAGVYEIKAELTNPNQNYVLAVSCGTYTVTENSFAVTAKDKHGVYSDEATYAGFNIEVTAPEGAKTYYSTTTQLDASNYQTAGLETLVNLPAGAGMHDVFYYVTNGTDAVSGCKSVIIDKAEQAAPTGLTTVAESVKGAADGVISGLKPREAEYRPANNGGTYATAYQEAVYVPAGTYLVRKPGDENHFASPDTTVTVDEGPTITVTFDSNGGSAVAAAQGLVFGDLVPRPRTPTLDGYDFTGWTLYGRTFDFSTPVTNDITLTASWKQRGGNGGGGGGGGGSSSSASNEVTLPKASEGGTVSANFASAKAGDMVTLTVRPNPGYKLSYVSVTDKNGNAVPVFENPDGTYTFKMPSSDVTVTPNFVKDETNAAGGFKDLDPNAWYMDGISWCLENGLMNGVGDDMFAPNDQTSRAMIVTMLWRMEGEPESGTSAFTDVADGSWYAQAVSWAAENGIVNGVSETEFAPDSPLTREQLAAILYRYAQTKGQGFTGMWAFRLDYSDIEDISEYAYEPMCWMVMNDVIGGMGDGTLAPQGNATRAQVATMLMRFSAALSE